MMKSLPKTSKKAKSPKGSFDLISKIHQLKIKPSSKNLQIFKEFGEAVLRTSGKPNLYLDHPELDPFYKKQAKP